MIESRWPAIIAILAVLALLEFLPGRIRVLPVWFPYCAAAVLLLPMFAEQFTHNETLARLERFDIYVFAAASVLVLIWTLARLVQVMIAPAHEVGGVPLLASAIGVWVINVIVFALVYWELDRGGPNERARGEERLPDISFPENPGGGRLAFIDYLFFAYTTATAFSPAETYPSSARMKVLMMLQSTISLATILVVAGRAINILK